MAALEVLSSTDTDGPEFYASGGGYVAVVANRPSSATVKLQWKTPAGQWVDSNKVWPGSELIETFWLSSDFTCRFVADVAGATVHISSLSKRSFNDADATLAS